MKTCTKCSQTKLLSKFYKNKNRKDGYQCYCIECQTSYIVKNSKKKFPKSKDGYKYCYKCEQELPIGNFYKNKYTSTGYTSLCKKCQRDKNNSKAHKIFPVPREGYKYCIECEIEKSITEFYKDSSRKSGIKEKCKICTNKNQKINRKKDTYETKFKRKIYYNKNKEKILKLQKEYNKSHYKKRTRTNYKHSKEYILKYNKYRRLRYNYDISYRLKNLLSNRIRMTIKNHKKSDSTMNLVGTSLEGLKSHLQQTAINNGYVDFNIDNFSSQEYHIDHIIPCCAFKINCKYHQKLCFNYTNLQILESKTNQSKNGSFFL